MIVLEEDRVMQTGAIEPVLTSGGALAWLLARPAEAR
jgi:hypothetical protein